MPSKTSSAEKENQEILLKEYETTRVAFNQVEGVIWQSAAIFMALSIGGVSFLFSIDKHDWGSFTAVAAVGLISIFILWFWYSSARRWWGLEGVFLLRLREIEVKLGMWTQRYIHYLDTTRIYKQNFSFAQEQEKETFANLDKKIRYYGKIPARNLMRTMVIVLVMGWLVLVTREFLLVFVLP